MARKKSKQIQARQENEVRFSIALDKDLDKWIRIEAVKADVSRVVYIAQVLQQHRERTEKAERRALSEKYSHIREIQEEIRQGMKGQEHPGDHQAGEPAITFSRMGGTLPQGEPGEEELSLPLKLETETGTEETTKKERGEEQ